MSEVSTRTIWVISHDDPGAEDLEVIQNFVNHFGFFGDIDINCNGLRIVYKSSNGAAKPSKNGKSNDKPEKRKYKKHSISGSEPTAKHKEGAGAYTINNTDFPNIPAKKQPKTRCTGCGTYKKIMPPRQFFSKQNEPLHIGICSKCSMNDNKMNAYEKKDKELS